LVDLGGFGEWASVVASERGRSVERASRRKRSAEPDLPHLGEHAAEVSPPPLRPQLHLTPQVPRMVHRIVQVPMPEEAEPELLTWPNRAIVRASRGERVGGSDEGGRGGGKTGYFVREEGDVAFVALAVDDVGVELVGEAEDGEPADDEVVRFRSSCNKGKALE
jgi:hypothetical protein